MKKYKTSDLYIASLLYLKKCNLKKLLVDNDGKITFSFEDPQDREDLIRAFYIQAEGSYVYAKEYKNAVLDLKNMIFEVKRNAEKYVKEEEKNGNFNEGKVIKQ